MTPADGSDPDFRRSFNELIAKISSLETHEMYGTLMGAGSISGAHMPRPDLRRAPLGEPTILTVRMDLQEARPPIWRRLELRGDLTLAQVHRIIQVSFDWLDYHLHRFALGGHPFDPRAQLFLCPFDVEEGEDEGLPAAEVRLDETLQDVGDTLRYVYDYGDDWRIRLKVEAVRSAPDDAPDAVATGGRRAAPPEDCGGITDAESLAEVLADPAFFDLGALQQALDAEQGGLAVAGLHPALADVAEGLDGTPAYLELSLRLIDVVRAPEPPELKALAEAQHPIQWYLVSAAVAGCRAGRPRLGRAASGARRRRRRTRRHARLLRALPPPDRRRQRPRTAGAEGVGRGPAPHPVVPGARRGRRDRPHPGRVHDAGDGDRRVRRRTRPGHLVREEQPGEPRRPRARLP